MSRHSNQLRRILLKVLIFSLCLQLSAGSYLPIPSAAAGQKQSLPATNAVTGAQTKAASPQTVAGSDPEGGAILIGQRNAGIIDDNADADVFQFQGVAGESVRIEANATSGGLDPTGTFFVDPSLRTASSGSSAAASVADASPNHEPSKRTPASIGAGPLHADRFAGAASTDLTPSAANAFSAGDVFAAVGNGKVKRFSPTGTLLQTLDSGSNSQFTAGNPRVPKNP